MPSLAETHLHQGRSFLRSGDARRAVELLERARSLARDDKQVLRDATAELARAYEQVGEHERAGRCREQLEFLPNAASTAAGGVSVATAPSQGLQGPRRVRRRRWSSWMTVALITIALLAHAGLYWGYRSWRAKQEAAVAPPPATPATQPAHATAPPSPPPPSPAPVAVPAPAATAPVGPTIAATVAPLDAVVRENVGLLIVLAHYEGRVRDEPKVLDVPLSQGTAFVVGRDGTMLTNKHVVSDPERERRLPASLDRWGLPTVTFRSTTYLVCFGPGASQRVPAKVVHSSDKFDLAVLRAEQPFATALELAARPPRLGEDVIAAGFPHIVQEAFDDRAAGGPMRLGQAAEQLRANRSVDLVAEQFGPQAFSATVTRGVISTAERFLGGVAHAQFDARVSSGNSGGPLLDADRRVIAIVTKGGTGAAQGYNFGLLVDQLRDELAPWVLRK